MGADPKKLQKLLDEKRRFLEEHPHLRPLQRYVDECLKEAEGDPQKRAKIMHNILMDHYKNELLPAIDDLKKIRDQLDKIMKKKKKAG